jgi:hypothetical protein
LGEGGVSLDQVRALCRFTTGDDEDEVLRWARDRAASELQAVARDHEGDVEVTVAGDNVLFADREVSWWWSEDRRLHLKATLPPDYGVVVVKALERIAYQALPDEQGFYEHVDARCADALLRVASQSIGADSDPDRATVVIHVDVDVLGGDSGWCWLRMVRCCRPRPPAGWGVTAGGSCSLISRVKRSGSVGCRGGSRRRCCGRYGCGIGVAGSRVVNGPVGSMPITGSIGPTAAEPIWTT